MTAMITKSTTLEFTYQRKRYTASVSAFQPDQTKPIVRVFVRESKTEEHVFVFYRMVKDELFWYDLPDARKQGMAGAIAHKLLEG